MSEKQKETMNKFAQIFNTCSEFEQGYILGRTEEMAARREGEQEEPDKNTVPK